MLLGLLALTRSARWRKSGAEFEVRGAWRCWADLFPHIHELAPCGRTRDTHGGMDTSPPLFLLHEAGLRIIGCGILALTALVLAFCGGVAAWYTSG